MTAAAVFLDRDGVLIECEVIDGLPHPAVQSEPQLLPRVDWACDRLKQAGLLLICVTNQPDIARGTTPSALVEAVNAALLRRLPLDAVMVCPHDDDDDCECRKPRPGLLLQAADRFGIELGDSVMVGDRWRDIEAGRRAGCGTVFVDRGYSEQPPASPDTIVASLADAVPYILSAVAQGAPPGQGRT
ncbi:MAG: HAD-IIIA family hydrolase [Candidatus Dormibacteraeota bacterium]|nr:HAD-IIIA family hydrolase [Candidatus Dormibacteraeota bacterium]